MRKHGILFQKGVEKIKARSFKKKGYIFWVVLLGRGRRKVKGVFVHEKTISKVNIILSKRI